MTFQPRTLNDFYAGLEEGRRALRDAPDLTFANPPPEGPPAPGTYTALLADLRAAREMEGVPDLRSGPRRRVDDSWQRVSELVLREHGRPLPIEIYDLEDAGQEGALRQARAAEAAYVQLAGAPYVTRESLDAAFNRFSEAVSDFVARVTAGWPSALERSAAERRRLEEDWR